jgi:hypothetical protein
MDRPVNEAPAHDSSSGKRGLYGCRRDDQVAVEDEITSVVKNEIGGARSVRLPRFSDELRQLTRPKNRTPTSSPGLNRCSPAWSA